VWLQQPSCGLDADRSTSGAALVRHWAYTPSMLCIHLPSDLSEGSLVWFFCAVSVAALVTLISDDVSCLTARLDGANSCVSSCFVFTALHRSCRRIVTGWWNRAAVAPLPGPTDSQTNNPSEMASQPRAASVADSTTLSALGGGMERRHSESKLKHEDVEAKMELLRQAQNRWYPIWCPIGPKLDFRVCIELTISRA